MKPEAARRAQTSSLMPNLSLIFLMYSSFSTIPASVSISAFSFAAVLTLAAHHAAGAHQPLSTDNNRGQHVRRSEACGAACGAAG